MFFTPDPTNFSLYLVQMLLSSFCLKDISDFLRIPGNLYKSMDVQLVVSPEPVFSHVPELQIRLPLFHGLIAKIC